MNVPGLTYLADYVNAQDETTLVAAVDAEPPQDPIPLTVGWRFDAPTRCLTLRSELDERSRPYLPRRLRQRPGRNNARRRRGRRTTTGSDPAHSWLAIRCANALPD